MPCAGFVARYPAGYDRQQNEMRGPPRFAIPWPGESPCNQIAFTAGCNWFLLCSRGPAEATLVQATAGALSPWHQLRAVGFAALWLWRWWARVFPSPAADHQVMLPFWLFNTPPPPVLFPTARVWSTAAHRFGQLQHMCRHMPCTCQQARRLHSAFHTIISNTVKAF